MLSVVIAAIVSSGSVGGPSGPPTAPGAFADGQWGLLAGDTEIQVTISGLPSTGGSPILDIEYRVDGGSWTSSGGLVTFDITGLSNGTEYDIEIRAVNAVGNGNASSIKSETPSGPPPTGDYILQENNDRLLLETNAPLNRDTGIPAVADAAPLTGGEYTVIVQSGNTVKIRTDVLIGWLNG